MHMSFLTTTVLATALIGASDLGWGQSAENGSGALLAQTQTPTASPGSNADSLAEIVVTATKFGASELQKTPITINAISGDQLAERDVTGPQGLMSQVSGLMVDPGSSSPRIFIRGIGQDLFDIGTEGGVAVYQDGVYISRVQAIFSPFNDLADVEVLKGPQGASFGRNATGGAVLYNSNLPESGFSGEVTVGGGSNQDGNLFSYVTGGTQELSGRLAAYANYDGGYVKNTLLDKEEDGVHQIDLRGTMLYQPNDALRVILRLQFDDEHSTMSAQDPIGIPGIGALFGGQYVLYNEHSWTTASDVYPFTDTQTGIYSATVNYNLGNAQLKSITGLVTMIWNNRGDYDDSTAEYLTSTAAPINDTEFTQEFDLTGQVDRLQWAAGMFYLHEKTRQDETIDYGSQILPYPEGTFIIDHHWQTLQSGAAFTELKYSAMDQLRISGGIRFTRDTKSFTYENFYNVGATGGVPNGTMVNVCDATYSAGFNSWTGDLSADYDLAQNSLAYVRYSRGFKAGGFSDNVCGDAYKPETVNAYEIGVKNNFFDRRLTLNASAFFYNYDDMQVSVIVPTGGAGSPTLTSVANAARSQIAGLDLDLVAKPVRNWTTNLGFSWLPIAKYLQFNSQDPYVTSYADFGMPTPAGLLPRNSGVYDCAPINGQPNCVYNLATNRLNRSPKYSAAFGTEYTTNLTAAFTLTGRGEVDYVSGQYYSVFNSPFSQEPQHGLVNLLATLAKPEDKWSVKVFVTNLCNKFYYTGRYDNATILTESGEFGRPREFGAKFTKKF
jgi:iron complex outermembrane receptor protein